MAPSLIRTLAASLLLAIPALTLAASARAETWPDKPIHIIVPYVAGGNKDSNARLIGAKLSEALGQPVIIDNMPAPAPTSAQAPRPALRRTATRCSRAPARPTASIRACFTSCPTIR